MLTGDGSIRRKKDFSAPYRTNLFFAALLSSSTDDGRNSNQSWRNDLPLNYFWQEGLMNKKRWIALIVFLIMLISVLINPPSLFTGIFPEDKKWEETIYKDGGTDHLAMIDIKGVILAQEEQDIFSSSQLEYDHEILLDQLDSAFEDEAVKGVIVRINSPGGGVADCDEIFQKIRQLKNEYTKPVIAYLEDVATSGAYLISAASDKIYANRHTLTGSIGVIMSTYNVHELAEKWGVRDETFKSGPYKDILNPLREVSESERRIMQELIDESYLFLIDSILEERNMKRETLLTLSDGRLYSSQQARDNGLIDTIGLLDDAINEVEILSGIENATVIRYKKIEPSPIRLLFEGLGHSISRFKNLSPGMDFFDSRYPSLMYIWSW